MKLLLTLALAALVGVQDPPKIYAPGDGVSLPQVTKQVKAEYTAEAMQNRIEGKVGLDTVVLADGKVVDVNVAESLDSIYGLDKNAVADETVGVQAGHEGRQGGRRPRARDDQLHAALRRQGSSGSIARRHSSDARCHAPSCMSRMIVPMLMR
jgi:hypothetical protein